MADVLERLGRSLIQHGPHGDRVYVMVLSPSDMPGILDEIQGLARERGYGKIIAKARDTHLPQLLDRGFECEARIPEFFEGREDLVFVGKFLDAARALSTEEERIHEVLEVAGEKGVWAERVERELLLPEPGIEVTEAGRTDAEALARCYGEVFESYPFPIHDPAHLRHEMKEGTRFFGAWEGSDLVAASSMESGGAPGSVEMTDFATLPSHRGEGLATVLLSRMEEAAREARERVAFTIARAVSFGMNITFARRGYRFSGTLVNNTQIGGSIESMNVWYKMLCADSE